MDETNGCCCAEQNLKILNSLIFTAKKRILKGIDNKL